LLVFSSGLKRALDGVVELNAPNIHVLPLNGKPMRMLLDNPPAGLGQIRQRLLKALGWSLGGSEPLDWCA
jgi:hypothetical protein